MRRRGSRRVRHTERVVAVGEDDGTDQLPEGGDAPEGYEDLVRIEQGGFAVVYRARDTRFDRTVALKVLRSERLNDRQLRRFRAECLATGRVSSHPNIVTVYDAGMTRGRRPWLAMEYCSGGSLAHKVTTQGPLPVAEVISIGVRLCSALSAAHKAGILHRDVKPGNVLLTLYGEPALADFGIASVLIEDDTMTETAAYTVMHAAPEILEGRAGTAASDIYSLGSTLFTLVAGQAPFATEAKTGLAPLVTRIMRGDLPVIARPGVPTELEALLRRSMAADPSDRPGSAAELGATLADLGLRLAAHEIGDQEPATARPAAEPTTATAPRTTTRRLILILGGALVALLATFTALGLSRGSSQPDELSLIIVAGNAAPAAEEYTPQDVVVAQGPDQGELIVSWSMPIRPDVVATVIYEGAGAAKARAIISYDSRPVVAPQSTLHGLPKGRQVCLSVAHVVSLAGVVTNAVSHPACAVPR